MYAKTQFTSLAATSILALVVSVLATINVLASHSGNLPVSYARSQRKTTDLHNDGKNWNEFRKTKSIGTKYVSMTLNPLCYLTGTFPCLCAVSLGDDVIIDCSHRNLTFVPKNIPQNVTELLLSYNKIETLPNGVFMSYHYLQSLDISYNNLSYLGSGAFDGLHQLRTLRLDGNPFKMSNKTFPDDVFDSLKGLVLLSLKSNLYVDDPEIQYPDVALGKLSSLETLLINGLSNKTFGEGVRNMTSLQTLDLSWTSSFRSISKDTFVNFCDVPLKNLLLSHCDLRWVHKEAFTYLPNIDTIDYSYNKKLEIKGVGISFYGLQNSTIRKIVMQWVHAKSYMTVVKKEDVQYIKNTNLEELHAENNTIGQLEEDVLLLLPLSIKVLRVSWNNIQTNIRQLFHLSRLKSFTEFDASYQTVFSSGAFGRTPKADRKIEFNETSPELRKIRLNTSRTKNTTGNHVDFGIIVPPNLWLVNVSDMYKLRMTIPYFKLINSSLSHLNVADNLLDKWIGPVEGSETLLHLDLTGNNCYEVSETFFAYATNLETLLIGNNRLGKDFSENTFHNLTKLNRLDINHNQLETVGRNLFSRLTNLTYLNLSGNYLSNWKANISGLVKLRNLDLSNNKLKALPLSLCRDLDTIHQFSPIQIDIHGNKLQCTCKTEYFIEWLTQTKIDIRNLNSTSCTLENGTVLSLSGSTSILNHLQRHCRSYTVLTGGLCAGVALFLIMALLGIVRRHRWKLRYLFYMATNWRKRTGYQRLDTAEENPFSYDIFVSYEDSDRTFIREQVIPRLERDAGLKLCVDKRDFIPGLYVTDNILHAIQNSRKTVVFLSRKFLKSKWCVYEMNMARMEAIHSGRDVLVMVLTEKIPTSQLSADIVDVIHNQTYMEMTNNRYGEALFWERLASAIKAN
ncbi:toll-like receptor 4 [Liolophura sinensis]|uniref:toll-like receptor 4 n=1 Tax=Liolophura sinensis TaxID=3198878 RepID=UPI003159632B